LKKVAALMLGLVINSQANAMALTLPMTAADIKSAIEFGAMTPEKAIILNPAMQLGNGESRSRPWGCILTPFEALAFASSQAYAKQQDVDAAMLRAVKAATTFDVAAEAFGAKSRMNDEMVVVIKQNGKVIHPVRTILKSDEEVIIIDDETGYRTIVKASFSYKSVDLKAPFTVVIANDSADHQETSFDVDPTAFR
jgi:hypothetical protein